MLEHQNLHQRLVATARSLKKQKRKLKKAEDSIRIRWSKVLNTAHKYGSSRHTRSYPKRKLLPEFDEEAIKPPQSKIRKPQGRIDDPTIDIYQQRAPHSMRHASHTKIHIRKTARPDPSIGQESKLQ